MFVYKYTAITAGSLIILGAHMFARSTGGRFVGYYKYFAFVNAWLYTMYLLFGKLRAAVADTAYGGYMHALPLDHRAAAYNVDYLIAAAAIALTFCFAYAFTRLPMLSDSGTKVLSVAFYFLGVAALFYINSYASPVAPYYFRAGSPGVAVTAAGTAVLFVLAALSVLALRDVLLMVMTEGQLGVEWYPIAISAYCVVILTQNLIYQYNLAFSSAIISVIYVLTALGWIIFGFLRRYSYIRKFGLGLAILSVVKVFVIDLYGLTQGYRILSFFILGLTLLAISYVYQYFSKRLELKEGLFDKPDE